MMGAVSLDIFLQRFESGEEVLGDVAILEKSLAPYLAEPDDAHSDTFLRFADGEADIYGADDLAGGFMVNNASGSEVWDVLMLVATRARLTITPPGCPAIVTTADDLVHLPPDLAADAVVLQSGAQLLECIESH